MSLAIKDDINCRSYTSSWRIVEVGEDELVAEGRLAVHGVPVVAVHSIAFLVDLEIGNAIFILPNLC
jgi:hypothetical protein